MSADLATALNDVTFALSPLPDGYYIEANEKTGSILVCCKYPEPDGLGFAITKQTIADGLHVQFAEDNFGDLMRQVEGQPSASPELRGVANATDTDHVE